MNQRRMHLLFEECQATATLIVDHAEGSTVFLVDEHHDNNDLLIDNINIVKTLIRNCGVGMVAIEGMEGDKITRRDFRSPNPDRCFGISKLAFAILPEPMVEVVGVDSLVLFKEIEKDCLEGSCCTPAEHPNQARRSTHMLQALIGKLNERSHISGSVLTAGTRHIDDIVNLLRAPERQHNSDLGPSFVRIRSRLYPTA